MTEPAGVPVKTSPARQIAIGASVVILGFMVGYALLRRPCPCREQLGEGPASAEAIATASAVMAQYPPLPDFGTERVEVPTKDFDEEATG